MADASILIVNYRSIYSLSDDILVEKKMPGIMDTVYCETTLTQSGQTTRDIKKKWSLQAGGLSTQVEFEWIPVVKGCFTSRKTVFIQSKRSSYNATLN